VTASVLALRDQGIRPATSPASRWEPAYVAAVQRVGLCGVDAVGAVSAGSL